MNYVILRTNTSDFGKVGSYNVQEIGLAKALIEKGHKVSVLFLNRDVRKIEKDDYYDFVFYIPHFSIGLHGIFKLSILNSFSPQKLILFSDNQLWAREVTLWCKKNNVLCIHYFGNVLSDNKRWLNQFYTKLILKRNIKAYKYSVNVAKTQKVFEEMKQLNVPVDNVIPVGLDKTLLSDMKNINYEYRAKLGLEKDELVMLFIGRLVNYKKPLLACDILRELLNQGINSKLIIIGKGPMKDELIEHIKNNGLEKNIMYIEAVPYKDIFKFMISSDCLINLSSQEIFGMTILEAMYYGLTTIARDAPGPNQIITHGHDGYICHSDDVKKWSSLILNAVKHSEIIGHNSVNTIKENYMWDVIASQFENK